MDCIDELLFEILRGPDDGWSQGVEALCAAQLEHAAEIHRRFKVLRDLGLETVVPITPPADFPERLGDFRLKERLGGGGMGVVYLAEQVSLQRTVALKLVRPELLYFPKAKDRFQREVETVAKLSHPGIVAIHAVGEEQGIQFFAMEHVAGISLEQAVHELAGKAPERLAGADLARLLGGSDHDLYSGSWPDVCLKIAQRVAEALAHAHARGVIHRDVKPSNVMLTRDGRVVLLDFGLAVAQGTRRVTRTGAQLGSLPYMAPEQVRGEHDRVDARSDVYSLGVTLYELLTLRSPFESGSAETTRKNILLGAPTALRVLNRQASSDAAIVCGKALDLDPRRRYQSAADFERDLENLIAHRAVEARSTSVGRQVRLWVQRHPTAAVGLGLGFVLVVGTPSTITFSVAGQRDRARTAETLALANAYAANLTAASTALQSGNALEARRRHELCPPELRGWEWRHLALCLDASLLTMRGHGDEVTAVALSHDARLAVSGAKDGEVIVWDAGSAAELARMRVGKERIVAVAFDEQAQRVHAADEAGAVAVFDRGTGRSLASLPAADGFLAAAIANDASSIWRNRGGWNLQELDPESLVPRRELRLEPADHPPEQLSIRGKRLLAETGPYLDCWELDRGGLVGRWSHAMSSASAFVWDRSGAHVARGFQDGTVLIVELATGNQILKVDTGTAVNGLAFSARNELLAVAGRDGSVRVFDAVTGERLAVKHGHTGSVNALACNGSDIPFLLTGSADRTVKLWSALTAPAVTSLSRHASVLAVTPDGRRLLSGSHDGTACLWDPTSGVPLHLLARGYHWVNTIAASPDGATFLLGTREVVFVQDTVDGTSRGQLDVRAQRVRRCTFSRDGSRFATGHEDGSIKVWDATSRRELHVMKGQTSRIRGLVFGAQNDVLFSGDEHGLVLRWDLAGEPVSRTLLAGRAVCRALLLTPDMRWLLCAHEDVLRSLDPQTGTARWARSQAEPLRSLAMLPDGSRALTGMRDGTLTFWDPEAGEPLLSFRAHDADIHAIACDPQGRWCATAAEDNRIRLWRTLPPGGGPPAIDEATLLVQVALHHCQELVWEEILAARALRAAAARVDWSQRLRARICELLHLHGGSGAWRALAHAHDLARRPNASPAELERAHALWVDVGAVGLVGADATWHDCVGLLLQFRFGRYAEVETRAAHLLQGRAAELNEVLEATARGTRAMSLHRLGRRGEAEAELANLREVSRRAKAEDAPRVLAFLTETEEALRR